MLPLPVAQPELLLVTDLVMEGLPEKLLQEEALEVPEVVREEL